MIRFKIAGLNERRSKQQTNIVSGGFCHFKLFYHGMFDILSSLTLAGFGVGARMRHFRME